MSDTYCVIGKLKIVPIEGAKTLQLGYYGGLPYAISKDITEDKLKKLVRLILRKK